MSSPATSSPAGQNGHPLDPFELFGELMDDVQHSGIFVDQKTFVDCLPKIPPTEIMERYRAVRGTVSLKDFVYDHFLVPEMANLQAFVSESVDHHLEAVWELLRREPHPVPEGSSLLTLTHPYVIPGGRFREIYYWDSYFIMLGLRISGREPLIRAMVDNFAELLERFGMIPNGNRTYYLSRSQPPALALMVEFLAEKEGPEVYRRYLPALERELAYWNDQTHATRHLVTLTDGSHMHRYYDQDARPRPEAFAKDKEDSKESRQTPEDYFRNIRSATESGWDFSRRWCVGGPGLKETRTTELVAVDLNCLLHQLERTLARAYEHTGSPQMAQFLNAAADARAEAILRHCWNPAAGFFFDYNFGLNECHDMMTVAGVTPLFSRIATQEQADAVAEVLRTKFLQPGGLVTTLTESGEQWDWPNGWAPMQWMAIVGLRNYGHAELAKEIAERWIRINCRVFARTGRFLEKYNVVDMSLPAGGGEYPTQDGFGWTNGVLARLRHDYPDLKAAISCKQSPDDSVEAPKAQI